MRLILPLDIAYAMLYSVYIVLVVIVRDNKSALSLNDYTFYYCLIQTVFRSI